MLLRARESGHRTKGGHVRRNRIRCNFAHSRYRRVSVMTACPICHVRRDPPITSAEAEVVIEISAKMGSPLEARKCQRVPGRVHLVVPPDPDPEPGTEPGT
jgi:hypothetical protein